MKRSLPFSKIIVLIFCLCMVLQSTLSMNTEQASNAQVDALGEPIGDNPGYSPLIDAPTLYSPSNYATIMDDTPILDWNSVESGDHYRIQVDNNADFSSMEFNEITNTFSPSITDIECSHLNDGFYYWRVRSYTWLGVWSEWSSVWHFTVDTTGPNPPVLVTPPNTITIYDSTPLLDWNPSSTAVEYRIQADDSSSFASPLFTRITPYSYLISPYTLSNRAWYWRVQARDAVGNWGSYSSNYRYFRVDTNPPVLYTPVNGLSTNDTTPTFVWAPKSTANFYNLEVDDNSGFTSPISRSTAGTSFTCPYVLDDGVWFWRVRACDSIGNYGPFSSYRYFIVDTTPPSNPLLVAPTDGTMTNDVTPYLDWSLVSTANLYRVQVDNDPDFSSPIWNACPSTNSYTCTIPLSETTWYWRVQARDSVGNWGSWSATWHFEIDTTPPATLTLLTPSNNTIDSDSTPFLEWSSVSSAVLYQLQIDNDLDFSSTNVDIETIGTDYTAITSLADDVYYWRVRAKDGAENWGDWSDVLNFQVDTIAPEIADVVFDNTPTDLDVVFVYCNVTDSNGLDVVTLHYRVNGGVWTNATMIWAIDNQYDVNLGTFAYDDFIEFFISANDTCINPNIAIDDNGGLYYSFTIISGDITGPTISNISHIPDPADDTEMITISCDVTDTNGIQTVTLYCRTNGGSWTDVSMDYATGDTYEVTIGLFDYADEIEYYIVAVDDSPNHNIATENNGGSYYSFTIGASDISGPTISDITHTPSNPDDTDSITISCTVVDVSGIDFVTLVYRIDGGEWLYENMTLGSADMYSYTIGTFTFDALIEYYIVAFDDYVSSNSATDDNGGAYYNFTIVASDTNGPTITNIVHIPTNPTDVDSVIISCTVVDASGVDFVTLVYRVDGGEWMYANMSEVTANNYEYTVGTFAYGELIEYYIIAFDDYVASNAATDDNGGLYYSILVGASDVDGPTITEIVHDPATPTDEETITIRCSVTDGSGVQSVTLIYRVDGGSWIDASMTLASGSTYEVSIGSFAYSADIEYYINATDSYITHNTATDDNTGSYYIFTVASSDVTAPSISDIEYNPNAPSHTDLVNITCAVSDLNGINSVVLHYRINGGTWTTTTMLLISGDQYKTTIGTFAADDLIEFYITATDDSPNSNIATDDSEGNYYNFIVLTPTTSNSALFVLLPFVAVLALVVLRKKE